MVKIPAVQPPRRPELGSALLITLLIITSLLAGAAVIGGMQLRGARSADLTRNGLASLYCAESGLVAARTLVATNYALWNASFCNPPAPAGTGACVVGTPASEPAWLQDPALEHDLDGDTVDDFIITLKDNDDEQDPLANDLTVDNDLQVFIISTCTKFPEVQKQVSELVRCSGGTCSRKLWLRTK